jgi:hypothetical protein
MLDEWRTALLPESKWKDSQGVVAPKPRPVLARGPSLAINL